jgi:hypothetical protein
MTAQTILPANSASSGGYEVANSLRFAGAARDTYLTATFGSAPTLATKNTISLWFKRSLIDTNQQLYTTNSNAANIIFNRSGASTGPTAAFYTNSGQLLGPRLYRDSSAWMHFVYTFDSTQGTEANRTKVYINGVQETSFNNTAYPAQEASQLGVNGEEIQIGTRSNYDRIFDGYMAETAFVDGQALAADSFGEFDSDSGIWKPIDISGLTFGNNGFYLEYKQTGTSANSSGIGADTSGNDLHFAVNAFTAADQSTDTCTNNFATLNPLIYGSNYTWSEGNLQFTQAATNWDTTYSSIGVTKGKWYMEFKGKVGAYYDVGVTDVIDPTNNLSVNTGGVAWKSNSEFAQGGNVGGGLPSNVTSPASNTYTADDIIGIALDVDNETVYFAKNGTYEVNSDPTSGASKTGGTDLPNSGSTYFFAFAAYKGGSASGTAQVNFGGGSVDAISSGNTDADGHGNFEHAPPSGYFALCTKNLAEYGG